SALETRTIRLREVNWLGDRPLPAGGEAVEVAVKVRSTRAPQAAFVRTAGGAVEVELAAAEEGVAPGQACVFFADDQQGARVLGGGVIEPPPLPVRLPARQLAETALR